MIFLILISILFSIFSTTVLMYVSMATPIGPWIAPTLVLLGTLIFRFFYFDTKKNTNNLIYSVVAGSPGGILATALGFTFPTLYFLDKNLFNLWLSRPVFFISVIIIFSLLCGLLAFFLVNRIDQNLIQEQKLAFPIGELTYKMISSSDSKQQSLQLTVGVLVTLLFCILQNGFLKFKSVIPKSFKLFSSLSYKHFYLPDINFEFFPLCWAIGYITGHVIAVPLLAGTISKLFVAEIINKLFFRNLSDIEFMLAFCSGLVLFSAVVGFVNTFSKMSFSKNTFLTKLFVFFDFASRFRFQLPTLPRLRRTRRRTQDERLEKSTRGEQCRTIRADNCGFRNRSIINFLLLLIPISAFLFYFEFNLLSQIYLIIFTIICAYQIVIIAGKIGLAQLGRFATLVMIPGMLFFNLNYLQIVMVATFVEVVSGISTDLLFGRKIAYLSNVSIKRVKIFQVIGIFVGAISAGFVFFFFTKNLQLGSQMLFAQRAQARALLVAFRNFNYLVLGVGFLFGYVLKRLKLNPMLVLSGLLMPFNITISLLTGALFRFLTPKNYDFEPFWSGIFAAQSIWILISAF